MSSNPTRIPDLSVEFLSWLNTELRRRAGRSPLKNDEFDDEHEFEDDALPKQGLINRLKGYFLCSLSLATFVAAQIYFGI